MYTDDLLTAKFKDDMQQLLVGLCECNEECFHEI